LSSIVVPPAHAVASQGDLEAMALAMEDLRTLEHRMERTLAPQIAQGTVTVNLGRNGLLISLSSAGFFQSGSALPIASSLPALNKIGHAIATTPYDVRIEGHTDDVPIHNARYADNWELSTARATELTRLFIEEDSLVPVRLSAAGYAQYHPIASNLSEAGRSRNRRVDIIVLPTREPPAMEERIVTRSNSEISTLSEKADPKQLRKLLSRASPAEVPASTVASPLRIR
jgi:chemotaxis protein MotB